MTSNVLQICRFLYKNDHPEKYAIFDVLKFPNGSFHWISLDLRLKKMVWFVKIGPQEPTKLWLILTKFADSANISYFKVLFKQIQWSNFDKPYHFFQPQIKTNSMQWSIWKYEDIKNCIFFRMVVLIYFSFVGYRHTNRVTPNSRQDYKAFPSFQFEINY